MIPSRASARSAGFVNDTSLPQAEAPVAGLGAGGPRRPLAQLAIRVASRVAADDALRCLLAGRAAVALLNLHVAHAGLDASAALGGAGAPAAPVSHCAVHGAGLRVAAHLLAQNRAAC